MQIKLEKIAHALEHTLERPQPKFQPRSTKSALGARCPASSTVRVTCNSGDCDRIPSRWHRCVEREVNQKVYETSVTSYV